MKEYELPQVYNYLFSLLDISLVNFDSMTFDIEDGIEIPVDMSKISRVMFDDDYMNRVISDGNIWIVYNPISHTVESIETEHMAMYRIYDIANELFMMDMCDNPSFQKYIQLYDEFNTLCKQILKNKTRELITNPKGVFMRDKFDKDTYFQKRIADSKDIYYIIHRWWDKLRDGEVRFTDILNGEGMVYIARTDTN